MSAQKYYGKVVMWRDKPGGYGFIKLHDPNEKDEVFFYHKYLQMPGYKAAHPNTEVEFELGENHKGPMAIKIRILQLPDGTVPDYSDAEEE